MEAVMYTHDYRQTLVTDVIAQLPAQRVFILTDTQVGALYLKQTVAALETTDREIHTMTVPVGEGSKSLATYEQISQALADAHFDRHDALVSLGGGVIGDLGGYVASTYKRGIAFIQVPTSFTAQVDSSVGGKTALNLGSQKNVIGTFYQPVTTIIDSQFLDTLSTRNLLEGYVETIKMSLLAGGDFAALTATISTPAEILAHRDALIKASVDYKTHIVAGDFKDFGQRKFLNFGHTLGHAIELADPDLMHGEAVGIGMFQLAQLLMPIEIQAAIRERLAALGLPLSSQYLGMVAFYDNLLNDKKVAGSTIDLVVLPVIGQPAIQTMPLTEFKTLLQSAN